VAVEIPQELLARLVPTKIPEEIRNKLKGKLGYSDAVDRIGTTAAPLLGGFGMTLVGLTATSESEVRWPDPTLALLVLAVLLFVGAVQASFNARSWFIPLGEFLARLEATPDHQQSVITGTYSQGLTKHAYWLTMTRYAYNLGILFLLAGLTFVVIPRGGISTARYGVIGLAGAGFVIEALWFLGSLVMNRHPGSAPSPPAGA
jgi:hypothetical protein